MPVAFSWIRDVSSPRRANWRASGCTAALFIESFVKVLQLAHTLKRARFGQITVSADGSKIAANASKHSAVSCERAGKMLAQLEQAVQQRVAKAGCTHSNSCRNGRS